MGDERTRHVGTSPYPECSFTPIYYPSSPNGVKGLYGQNGINFCEVKKRPDPPVIVKELFVHGKGRINLGRMHAHAALHQP